MTDENEPIKLIVQSTDIRVVRSNIAETLVSGDEVETQLMVTVVALARFNRSDVTAEIEMFYPVQAARYIAQRLIEAAFVAEREWAQRNGREWTPE